MDPAGEVVLAISTPFPTATTLIGGINSQLANGQFGMQTTVTGGSNCGNVDVDVDSNTVIITNGHPIATPSPYVYAQVYGTGSCSSKMYAAQIILSSSTSSFTQPTTVSGPIQAFNVGTGGPATDSIQIQGGSGCGLVWATPGPNPVLVSNGQQVADGTIAQVTASGSCATSFMTGKVFLYPSATPTPTGTPAVVASHIPIADRCCHGYEVDSPSGLEPTAKPFINAWVGPDSQGVAQLYSAGVTTNISAYADPALIRPSDVPSQEWSDVCGTATSQSGCAAGGGKDLSAAAKDSSGNIVGETTSDAVLTDPHQTGGSGALGSWEDAIQIQYTKTTTGNYDSMFLDDIGTYTSTVYRFTGTPYYAGSAWAEPDVSTSYAHLIAALTISPLNTGQSQPKYILNAGTDSQYLSQLASNANSTNLADLINASAITTIDCEGCLGDNGTGSGEVYGGTQWIEVENEAIQLVDSQKIFLSQQQDCESSGQNSYNYRLYTYASFMLTWDPVYSLLENDYYGYPSDTCGNSHQPQIHVFPEELLTAYAPVVGYPSKSTGIAGLKDSNGTYFREYSYCYFAGVLVGRSGGPNGCAFVVNPDSVSHQTPTLHGTYTHTMVISTYNDVLSGGSVSLSGPAPGSSILSLTAEVLLP